MAFLCVHGPEARNRQQHRSDEKEAARTASLTGGLPGARVLPPPEPRRSGLTPQRQQAHQGARAEGAEGGHGPPLGCNPPRSTSSGASSSTQLARVDLWLPGKATSGSWAGRKLGGEEQLLSLCTFQSTITATRPHLSIRRSTTCHLPSTTNQPPIIHLSVRRPSIRPPSICQPLFLPFCPTTASSEPVT